MYSRHGVLLSQVQSGAAVPLDATVCQALILCESKKYAIFSPGLCFQRGTRQVRCSLAEEWWRTMPVLSF